MSVSQIGWLADWLAGAHDMDIPTCVEDGPSILEIIREHYAAWSQRAKAE